MRYRTIGNVAVVLALLGAALLISDADDVSALNTGTSKYTFDQVVKHNFDSDQNASFKTIGDGALALFKRDGQGLAMRFPAPEAPANLSPHVDGGYLAIDDVDDFYDPGTRDMTITVSLRMTSDLADHQMNIVQKGSFTQDQWKLQADNGDIGCRFANAGQASNEAFAEVSGSSNASGVDLFDDKWHNVTCTRVGDTVQLFIGQTLVASDSGTLTSLANDAEVSIGGILRQTWKHPVTEVRTTVENVNDQFHGELDNLKITFSS